MDHLAILAKERKLLAKIISGEKTIESRWYKFKKTPYENICVADTIYFKNSGEPVSVKAKVGKVLFFDNLDMKKIEGILQEYGSRICIPVSHASTLVGKNFCTLMFLEDVEEVESFQVNKRGYGLMAAWISVKSIDEIRKK